MHYSRIPKWYFFWLLLSIILVIFGLIDKGLIFGIFVWPISILITMSIVLFILTHKYTISKNLIQSGFLIGRVDKIDFNIDKILLIKKLNREYRKVILKNKKKIYLTWAGDYFSSKGLIIVYEKDKKTIFLVITPANIERIEQEIRKKILISVNNDDLTTLIEREKSST